MNELRKPLSLKRTSSPTTLEPTQPPAPKGPVVVRVVDGKRVTTPLATKETVMPKGGQQPPTVRMKTVAAPATRAPAPPKKKPAPRPKKPRVQLPRTRTPPTTVKAQALLAKLVVDYPALFSMEGEPTPWAIGIHRQIQTRYRVSQQVVKKTLTAWLATRGEAYRLARDSGKERAGLDVHSDTGENENGRV